MSESENELFENLAIQNMGNLYVKAIKLARNANRGEELVQRTFASAYCLFEEYDRNSDFDKWLSKLLMLTYKHLTNNIQKVLTQ